MFKANKKINFIFISFAIVAVGLISRAFYLQVWAKEKLSSYSRSQTLRERTVYPNRGNIFDRNGEPIAINLSSSSIFVMPKQIKNKKSLIKFAKILHGEKSDKYLKKIENRNRFTWLERKIELTEKQKREIEKLPGFYLEKTVKRYYPNNSLMSQVVGAVGVDNKGLSGIEFLLDQDLRGDPIKIKYVKDAKGRPVKVEKEGRVDSSNDIILSLDKDIQGYAEKVLKETILEYDAIGGGVGVMDVETGEVLAMANYPDYDPNNISGADIKKMKIPFVTDPFEPGSVFKVFTVASALENKKASKMTKYFCEKGSYMVDGHQVNEAESKKQYEWLSVQEILRHSSNIGTTKIAFDLGLDLLKKDLEKLGIGKKTNVQLPGESRGIFNYDKQSSRIRLSNLSFGQGVATTGIQILSAFSTLANGGKYMPPTVLKGGNFEKEGYRVFSEETVSQIEEMLVDSVYNGTGKNAHVEHFQIAGKTSTAQKPSKNKGYEGYIPAFVGFPTNIDRRFVIYTYIDSPKGEVYYGNVIAAPVFKKIARYVLFKDKKHFKFAIKKQASEGNDTLRIKQSSRKKYKKGIVPNLIGLDKKSATLVLKELGFDHEFKGIGIVMEQSTEPGKLFRSGDILVINLERPSYE